MNLKELAGKLLAGKELPSRDAVVHWLRSVNLKQLGVRLIVYGLPVYLAMAVIAYGLAWRAVPTAYDNLHGHDAQGPIKSLTSWGFGPDKDFYFTVEGSSDEFVLLGSVLHPVWLADGFSDLDFESMAHKGDWIAVHANPAKKPPYVVVEVYMNKGAGRVQIISGDMAHSRYKQMLAHGADIGNKYLFLGLACFLFLIPAHLLGRRYLFKP